MNSAVGVLETRTKDIKFWWPLPSAVVVWLVIVWGFGWYLATPQVANPPPVTIEARIVELPDPRPAPRPSAPMHQQPRLTPKRVMPKEPRPQKTVIPKQQPSPQTSTTPAEPPRSPAPETNTHPQGGERMGARATYQPLPKIPEDLRDEAINAVAMAQFHINVDGTATVELVKPTPNPRINQIILNTLRTWRFFPALQDGKPMPSTQEIKVNVDVS